jgi:hypothetical protein
VQEGCLVCSGQGGGLNGSVLPEPTTGIYSVAPVSRQGCQLRR